MMHCFHLIHKPKNQKVEKQLMRSRFAKLIDFESPIRQKTKVWSNYVWANVFESLRHEIFYPCWGHRIFHRKSNHPKNTQSQLPKIFYESLLKSSKVLIFKLQCFRKLQKLQLDLIFLILHCKCLLIFTLLTSLDVSLF